MFKLKKFKTRTETKPKLTYFLISLCIGIYLLELLAEYLYGMDFVNQLLSVYGFSVSGFLNGYYWNAITSIFLHGSPDHLILNMIALYFFGKVVESELGRLKFLLIFFLSGLFGDFLLGLTVLAGLLPATVPTVGASGAIFGLMGTAMFVKPFEMIFYPYLVPVPLFMVAILYSIYNIAAFLMFLVAGEETEIAYAAHIGGLLVGTIFGFRHEKRKKALLLMLLFLLVLLLIPFVWTLLSYLEATNYINVFTKLFK